MELVLKGITAQIMQHSWNIFKSVAEMSKAHNYYPVQTSSESVTLSFSLPVTPAMSSTYTFMPCKYADGLKPRRK